MSRTLLCLAAAAALLATGSCAGRRCCPNDPAAPAASPIPFKTSGFLADYSKLVPARYPNSWYWMKEGTDLRAYDNVLFEPVELRFEQGTQPAWATDELKEKMRHCFVDILSNRLAPYFPVLEKPAPHTLTAHLALTDVRPKVEGAGGEVSQVGGATLEGEFRDALTGEVLVTFVSQVQGSTRGEIAKEEWRPVEGAFLEWADRMLDFLELYAK